MSSISRIYASDKSGNASVATVTQIRAANATTQHVDTVSHIPATTNGFYGSMGTPHTFTDPVTNETITVISEATAVDFRGHIDTGNIIIDAIAPGYTDGGSKVGDIVIIRPTTQWADNIGDTLAAGHKDDGTHGNITVDSVLVNTTNQDLSNQYLYANAVINGGCTVAQRAAPNLSTSYQYGKVDRFAAKATGTAVSAGTINQLTSSLLAATKGYDLQIAGATITGTGIVFLRYRMEAKDALSFINAAASFGVRVYHNVGSAVNYTVYIRKANAADNFSATTDIANSGAISVLNATATWLKFENINAGSLGDVSNGIEIEIQIACGAVTTKNFNFAEFVFNKGAKAAAYMPRSYQHELAACQRYFLNRDSGTSTYSGLAAAFVGGGQSFTFIATPVSLRAVPTITGSSLGVRYGGSDFGGAVASTALSLGGVSLTLNTTGSTNGNSGAFWASDGILRFDAEL